MAQVTREGPGTFSKDFDYYEAVGEYSVYSWCPSDDGTGPATQVHLHLPFNAGKRQGKMVVRLKSKAAIDQLIRTLQEHRADVWGVI